MVWAASLDDTEGSSAKSLFSVTGRATLFWRALSRLNEPITACQMSECGNGKKYETSMKVMLQHKTDQTYEATQSELRQRSMGTIPRKGLPCQSRKVKPLPVGKPISSGHIVVQQKTHRFVSGMAKLHYVGTLNVRTTR